MPGSVNAFHASQIERHAVVEHQRARAVPQGLILASDEFVHFSEGYEHRFR